MVNGSGLNGNFSSTQSAVIVPLPNSNTIYYIFTLDGVETFPVEICYSIVDMTLDGGYGEITTKNQLIMSQGTERVTIIKHANDLNYWIVFHEWNSNNFYTFLLSNAGLNMTPIISSVGSVNSGNYWNAAGYMKSNADGNRIAMAFWGTMAILELYKFDNSTGILSSALTFNEPDPYGLEFSPSGQYLYVSNFNTHSLIQYDISTYDQATINNSKTTIYSGTDYIGALQLGPDNKIYASIWSPGVLSVVNNPDNAGISCNYQSNAISLNGRYAQMGLPTLVNHTYFIEDTIPDIDTTLTSFISFPNVFTPNGDHYNETFQPQYSNIFDFHLTVFNRWGAVVFETEDIERGWDGKTKGNECSDGTYFWTASYRMYENNASVNKTDKGSVTLMRKN